MDNDIFPKMNENLDIYLSEKVKQINLTKECRFGNIRTTSHTMVNFPTFKGDRLWSMKMNGKLIDAVFCTESGHSELVHLDLMLGLDRNMRPFFHLVSNAAVAGMQQENEKAHQMKKFCVDSCISPTLLYEIIYFAYQHKCALSEQNSVMIAEIAAKYSINSLVQYCVAFLKDHCSTANVLKGFELVSIESFANTQAKEFFQKYIEDNFEKLWAANKNGILNLNNETLKSVLQWDKLNIKSECTLWSIISAWTEYDLSKRKDQFVQLLVECLRFGRLPQHFLNDVICKSGLFLSFPSEIQQSVIEFASNVMNRDNIKQTIIDGHGLPYSKSLLPFRPRETKHLLIVAGGWIEGHTTNSIELYDYQLNMWLSTGINLSSVISYFGFEVVDSTIYVFGGSNGREIFKSVSSLDLSSKFPKWQNKCSMIERRCYVSSVMLDGQIYALGGFNQQRRIRKCERYCPKMNFWTEIADLNYARSDASASIYRGRIYIAGGINDSNIEQSVEVYCPVGNFWQLIKSMVNPRTSFAMACFQNRIWAIGGNDGSRRLNSVESYDSESDTWREEQPMINGRSTFRAIVLNDELHVVGGYNGENPVRSVEKYTSKQGWVKVRPLLHERSGLSLTTIPNIFDIFYN